MIPPRNLNDALDDAIRTDSETAAWMLGRALAEGVMRLIHGLICLGIYLGFVLSCGLLRVAE